MSVHQFLTIWIAESHDESAIAIFQGSQCFCRSYYLIIISTRCRVIDQRSLSSRLQILKNNERAWEITIRPVIRTWVDIWGHLMCQRVSGRLRDERTTHSTIRIGASVRRSVKKFVSDWLADLMDGDWGGQDKGDGKGGIERRRVMKRRGQKATAAHASVSHS